MQFRFLIGASLVAAMLVSCGRQDGKPVSREQFTAAGLQWPLTVGSGRIGCDGNAYWFEADDGTKYGLNGMAAPNAGYQPIEPIWAEDKAAMSQLRAAGADSNEILRINIGDMLEEASKLCGS